MHRYLWQERCQAVPHPDVMLTYGSKDSLVKVATTDAGLEDTHAYTTMAALEQQVLQMLLMSPAVSASDSLKTYNARN